MLSRVADAVHWMSRYIERAENIARFVDVNEHLTLDLPGDDGHRWRPLVAATGDDAWFAERYPSFDRSSVIRFLVFDPSYPSSIWSSLRAARENARSVREIISSEMWEQTNRAYLLVQRASRNPEPILVDPEPFLQSVKEACHQIHGSTLVTMTHNDAWHFMSVGRLLERADKTSRILDVKYFLLDSDAAGSTEDDLQWSALLQSASGLEMYRQRFGGLHPRRVVEFLLFDPQFPRAIRHCIERAELELRAVQTRSLRPHPRNESEKRLGRLRAELEFAEVEDVLEHGLHAWADAFQTKLNGVGEAINEDFFSLGAATSDQFQSQG